MANVQDRGPPSTAAIAIGTAVISGLTGYYLGQARSIGLFGKSSTRSAAVRIGHELDDDSDISDADAGSGDEENSVQDLGELKTFPDNDEECKLVLVVRTDLGMTKGMSAQQCAITSFSLRFLRAALKYLPLPAFASQRLKNPTYACARQASVTHCNSMLMSGSGKIAAQCSHATLACYKTLLRANHPILRRWENLGQAKVALKVGSEEDMLMLQAQAVSLGLCAQVIHDAGRTQIASGSATVVGIGPAPKSKVDEVTGHLTLL